MYLVLLLLACVGAVLAQQCPEQYARLSDKHSYCLPKNDQCVIVTRGVSEADRNVILQHHNELRNNIATGNVNRPDLPKASNMIELVWDNEIAAIAQKWMDQCHFEHDCNACRSTSNYMDGQNLAMSGPATCSTNQCSGAQDQDKRTPDWKGMIDLWYNEIQYVNEPLTTKYAFGMSYGHYSQLAWAKTWRVGCGYTVYMDGNGATKLYGCDYAPAGNSDNEPIYQSGTPCSQCPANTQCSNEFPGLCKLNDPNKAPVYPDSKQTIFNCDFSDNNPDCAFSGITGDNKWLLESRLWGTVLSAKLEGGQSTTLDFGQKIKPSQGFCLVFVVRKGPNVAGQTDNNVATAEIKQPPSMPSWVVNIGITGWGWFAPMSLTLFKGDTTFSITFSVPAGAPAQFIEVQRIYAYEGNC